MRRDAMAGGSSFLAALVFAMAAAYPGAAAAVSASAEQAVVSGPGSTIWFVSDDTGLNIEDAISGDGSGDAYDNAWYIEVNGAPFPAFADLDRVGNLLTEGPNSMSGLDVTVQYFFFSDRQLARILVKFFNPTGGTISPTVRVESGLGSDGSTVVEGTSGGDLNIDAGDRWSVTSDGALLDPVVTTVIAGPGVPFTLPTIFFKPSVDQIDAEFAISVPAGQTRTLMFFAGLGNIEGVGNTVAGALANTAALFNTNAFMTCRELLTGAGFIAAGQIINWDLPAVNCPSNLDFGDAPFPYPTALGFNGEAEGPLHYHIVADSPVLGIGTPDFETDGQPAFDAGGDDRAGINDEAGLVSFVQEGGSFDTDIRVSQTGSGSRLDAWIDFNDDGDWDDAGDRIADDLLVFDGIIDIDTDIPAGTVPGETFARLRVSTNGGLEVAGPASDGEVEDHLVRIDGDYGDAPGTYPVTLAQDGARHLVVPGGPALGAAPDSESDGQPSGDASGDGADEDGVSLGDDVDPAVLVEDDELEIDVTVTNGPALLDAWVDLNADGDWDDPGEKIISFLPVVTGINDITVDIPEDIAVDNTVALRVRLSTSGSSLPTGGESDGEVEDYLVFLEKEDDTNINNPPPPGGGFTNTVVVRTGKGGFGWLALGGLLLALPARRWLTRR